MFVLSRVSIKGSTQKSFVLVADTAAQSEVLPGGTYDCWSDVEVFIKVGQTADDVTSSTGYKIPIDKVLSVAISDGDKIGAVSAAAGKFSFHKIG